MQDFKDYLLIKISGKTRYAIISYLERYHADSEDISRFLEDAAIWRMLDREMAFKDTPKGEVVHLFAEPSYEGVSMF